MSCQPMSQETPAADTVKTYNHAFTIAFEVSGSTTEDGEDITVARYVAALQERIRDLVANEALLEAIGAPFDSFCEAD